MFFYIGTSNLFLLVLATEFFSWLFIVLLPSIAAFSYLVIQSYYVFLALIGITFSRQLLVVSFLLKLGFPPFHTWLLSLLTVVSFMIMIFALLFHKIFSLMVMYKIMVSSHLALNIVVLTFSSVLIFSLASVIEVLFYSSIIHTVWMMLSMGVSLGWLLFYWSMYSLFSFLLMKSISAKSTALNNNQSLLTFITWLILSGFPPFVIFWLKMSVLSWFFLMKEAFFAVSAVILTVLSLSAYYRVSHLVIGEIMHWQYYWFLPLMSFSFLGIFF